jgi:cyclopropane-fatty-acyl-phospholipid synthase
VGRALYRLRHLLNRNSRAGSRRNIHAHYDLGNPFYSVWLDPSMTYSSALFGDDPARSLQDAQDAKYRRILDALGAAARARACSRSAAAGAASPRWPRATGCT